MKTSQKKGIPKALQAGSSSKTSSQTLKLCKKTIQTMMSTAALIVSLLSEAYASNLLCDETIEWHRWKRYGNASWIFDHDNCEFRWGNKVKWADRILMNASAAFSDPNLYPINITMIVEPLENKWEKSNIERWHLGDNIPKGIWFNHSRPTRTEMIWTSPNDGSYTVRRWVDDILTEDTPWGSTSLPKDIQYIGIGYWNADDSPGAIYKGFYFNRYSAVTTDPTISPTTYPTINPTIITESPSISPTILPETDRKVIWHQEMTGIVDTSNWTKIASDSIELVPATDFDTDQMVNISAELSELYMMYIAYYQFYLEESWELCGQIDNPNDAYMYRMASTLGYKQIELTFSAARYCEIYYTLDNKISRNEWHLINKTTSGSNELGIGSITDAVYTFDGSADDNEGIGIFLFVNTGGPEFCCLIRDWKLTGIPISNTTNTTNYPTNIPSSIPSSAPTAVDSTGKPSIASSTNSTIDPSIQASTTPTFQDSHKSSTSPTSSATNDVLVLISAESTNPTNTYSETLEVTQSTSSDINIQNDVNSESTESWIFMLYGGAIVLMIIAIGLLIFMALRKVKSDKMKKQTIMKIKTSSNKKYDHNRNKQNVNNVDVVQVKVSSITENLKMKKTAHSMNNVQNKDPSKAVPALPKNILMAVNSNSIQVRQKDTHGFIINESSEEDMDYMGEIQSKEGITQGYNGQANQTMGHALPMKSTKNDYSISRDSQSDMAMLSEGDV